MHSYPSSSCLMMGLFLFLFTRTVRITAAQATPGRRGVHSENVYDYNGHNDIGDNKKERRLLGPSSLSLKRVKRRLLAVRVSAISEENGIEMPLTWANEIEAAIFGNSQKGSPLNPAASLVSQYKEVSHGQLLLVPATGNGVVNGVAEVAINVPIAGVPIDKSKLLQIIHNTTSTLFGGRPLEQVADHIIFCLPDGATAKGSTDWYGFTMRLQPYSYYQSSRCTKLSYMMHELGHSILGFRHSGLGNDVYADTSCYMGYAENEFGSPRKAFNAHKHWQSQWFSERHADVNPLQSGSPSEVRLVAFTEYSNPEVPIDDVMLLKVGNLYIQFNRAQTYNSETPEEYKDRVTIVEADEYGGNSNMVAALASGEHYLYKFPTDGGRHNTNANNNLILVVIEVCEIVFSSFDHAIISVHIADGIQQSTCPPPPSPPLTHYDSNLGAPKSKQTKESVARSPSQAIRTVGTQPPTIHTTTGKSYDHNKIWSNRDEEEEGEGGLCFSFIHILIVLAAITGLSGLLLGVFYFWKSMCNVGKGDLGDGQIKATGTTNDDEDDIHTNIAEENEEPPPPLASIYVYHQTDANEKPSPEALEKANMRCQVSKPRSKSCCASPCRPPPSDAGYYSSPRTNRKAMGPRDTPSCQDSSLGGRTNTVPRSKSDAGCYSSPRANRKAVGPRDTRNRVRKNVLKTTKSGNKRIGKPSDKAHSRSRPNPTSGRRERLASSNALKPRTPSVSGRSFVDENCGDCRQQGHEGLVMGKTTATRLDHSTTHIGRLSYCNSVRNGRRV